MDQHVKINLSASDENDGITLNKNKFEHLRRRMTNSDDTHPNLHRQYGRHFSHEQNGGENKDKYWYENDELADILEGIKLEGMSEEDTTNMSIDVNVSSDSFECSKTNSVAANNEFDYFKTESFDADNELEKSGDDIKHSTPINSPKKSGRVNPTPAPANSPQCEEMFTANLKRTESFYNATPDLLKNLRDLI